MRSCIACRRRRPQQELIRLRLEAGRIVADPKGERGPGRGAYVCAKMECWEGASRGRSLSRALRLGGEPVDREAPTATLTGMIAGSLGEPGPGLAESPAPT